MLDKKYHFIYQDLISKIFQNYYQGKLPTQRQLAEHYGVSRFTIQRAISKLESIGMIHAVQGDGLYIAPDFRNNTLISNSMIEASYDVIESKVISFVKIKTDEKLNKVFGLEGESYVWKFVRLRIVDFVSTQIETSYLPVRLFPNLTKEDVTNSIQGYAIDQGYTISHFITNYQATQLRKDEAELLNQKRNYPAMLIQSRGMLATGDVYVNSSIIALHYSCTYINTFNRAIYDSRRKKSRKRR